MSESEWDRTARWLVLLLAPFAPHLSEELWAHLSGPYSVHRQPWPEPDPQALRDAEFTLVIQVNGRVRDRRTAPAGAGRDTALLVALQSENVRRHLDGRRPKQVVFVPDRLINLLI